MAQAMFERGVLVAPFSFPVVPKGAARIRVQLSADHDEADLAAAALAFEDVGRQLGIVAKGTIRSGIHA